MQTGDAKCWCSTLVFAAFTVLHCYGDSYFDISVSETPRAPTKMKELRYKDKPFDSHTRIDSRTVSCALEQVYNISYPGPTYTCKNISVNDERISYGTMIKGAEHHKCGVDNGRNSIYWLCDAMLKAKGISEKPWAAYVTDAICTGEKAKRVHYVYDGSSMFWEDIEDINGFVLTLQCMTEEPVWAP